MLTLVAVVALCALALISVAPAYVGSVDVSADVVAAGTLATAAVVAPVVAPIGGTLALVALAVAVVASDRTTISPYGRDAHYRAPDAVLPRDLAATLAPSFARSVCTAIARPMTDATRTMHLTTWRAEEIARLTASLARARASRHTSRAKTYAARLATLQANA